MLSPRVHICRFFDYCCLLVMNLKGFRPKCNLYFIFHSKTFLVQGFVNGDTVIHFSLLVDSALFSEQYLPLTLQKFHETVGLEKNMQDNIP